MGRAHQLAFGLLQLCSVALPLNLLPRHRLLHRHGVASNNRNPVAAAAAAADASEEEGPRELIVGLNKYSHDTAVCVVDAATGEILFATEKERLTRRKHDAGPADDIVAHALECLDASLEDVVLCVQNNHHHRVAPFEERLPFGVDMNHYPPSYLSPFNLLPCPTVELSHHLAHAWSAIGTSPWAPPLQPQQEGGGSDDDDDDEDDDKGPEASQKTLVVVMDGMGELYHEMQKDMRLRADLFGQKRSYDSEVRVPYVHDLLRGAHDDPIYFVPSGPGPHQEW